MMKKTYLQIAVCFSFFLLFALNVHGADLPAADASLIKGAGIPIFTKAVFLNGSQDAGFRFATSKSPEEVGAWYIEHLPDWALNTNFGFWILYEGKPGLVIGELMMKIKQVQVQKNLNLTEWFGIDKEMSTEILIYIPRK